MKKTLVVVLAIAIGLCASAASAQIPNVVVYFDNTFKQMDAPCPTAPPGTVTSEIYVVANNFNMWVSAIEYRIIYPPAVSFFGDIVDDGPGGTQLRIGSSPTGIGISWPIPANGFGSLLCQKATILWLCQNTGTPENPWCGTANDQLIQVVPYPSSGQVRAIRWPDTVPVQGVGLTSVICPQVIPVEETTWGGIKALY